MLAIALIAFVGSHFLMSHPLRAAMISALGNKAFLLVYSLVSFATFAWAVRAFGAAPYGERLWEPNNALWAIASVLMLIGSILFVGSLVRNPALPDPTARAVTFPPVRGVYAITRHPMMWAFAIWSLVHIMVSPRPPVLLMSFAIAFLALVGAAAQDRKKSVDVPGWSDWVARTSFVPFGRGVLYPGGVLLVIGTLFWLIATFVHPMLGAPLAGVWRWIFAYS